MRSTSVLSVTLPPSILFAIDPLHETPQRRSWGPPAYRETDHTYLARNAVLPNARVAACCSFLPCFGIVAGRNTPARPLVKPSVYAPVFQAADRFTSAGRRRGLEQSARSAILLGWYSRVVTNLTSITSRRTSDCIGKGIVSGENSMCLFESPR